MACGATGEVAGGSVSLAALERDLVVDRGISARHALEGYGVSVSQATRAGLGVLERRIGLTYSARSEVDVTLIVWPEEARLRRASGSTLRHLAGVTAVRLVVGAAAVDWENEGGARVARHLPDGYWQRPDVYAGAVWAIEYDAGSYSSRQLLEKGRGFMVTHGYQVWGVASEARIRTVEAALDSIGAPRQVHFVPWC